MFNPNCKIHQLKHSYQAVSELFTRALLVTKHLRSSLCTLSSHLKQLHCKIFCPDREKRRNKKLHKLFVLVLVICMHFNLYISLSHSNFLFSLTCYCYQVCVFFYFFAFTVIAPRSGFKGYKLYQQPSYLKNFVCHDI